MGGSNRLQCLQISYDPGFADNVGSNGSGPPYGHSDLDSTDETLKVESLVVNMDAKFI